MGKTYISLRRIYGCRRLELIRHERFGCPSIIKEKNGPIVQISSYGGFTHLFDVGYGVAHAAMDRLSFDMATELHEHNVRAVTLHPGGGQT